MATPEPLRSFVYSSLSFLPLQLPFIFININFHQLLYSNYLETNFSAKEIGR